MKNKLLIYESPRPVDGLLIFLYLKMGNNILIVEPFHGFHHVKTKCKFYPDKIPSLIERFIREKLVTEIKSEEFKPEEIYPLSSDKAVDIIENVYDFYKGTKASLIRTLKKIVNSELVDDVFKYRLCDDIARFLSINSLFYKISQRHSDAKVILDTRANIFFYNRMKKLLSGSKEEFFFHENINFSKKTLIFSFWDSLTEGVKIFIGLSARVVISFLLIFRKEVAPKRRKYRYGFNLVSPQRQLRNDQRNVNFLVDNKIIKPEESLCFYGNKLSEAQQKSLLNFKEGIVYVSKKRSYQGKFLLWMKLFVTIVRNNFFNFISETRSAFVFLDYYFKWKGVLEFFQIVHFVTHCDLGESSIGRNVALQQAGAGTWYFTDSINSACAFISKKDEMKMRHPFWSYLNYDHFVTWSEFLGQYYLSHPKSFKEVHIVGCLWSSHINSDRNQRALLSKKLNVELKSKFVVAAFDSTYSCNGVTSFQEGIAFAKDLLGLLEIFDDIIILFKEKKDRGLLKELDARRGETLVNLYDEMNQHSRVVFLSKEADSSQLMSCADITISFPFTSTTFEAISARKMALWHDPLSLYKGVVYDKFDGLVTHGYESLKDAVIKIRDNRRESYNSEKSSALDPFCDGKAIERFRQLLAERAS